MLGKTIAMGDIQRTEEDRFQATNDRGLKKKMGKRYISSF